MYPLNLVPADSPAFYRDAGIIPGPLFVLYRCVGVTASSLVFCRIWSAEGPPICTEASLHRHCQETVGVETKATRPGSSDDVLSGYETRLNGMLFDLLSGVPTSS